MSSVIVVGAGQGGLSTAIHARLAGHDVIVVEKGRIGGKAGSIEQQGYLLDPGPSIIILKELYEEVFRRAGRDPEQYLTFQRLDPITRVFFRSEILDIPSSVDEACRLVKTFSPRDADSLRSLMVKMKPLEGIVKETIFKHPYETPQQMLDPKLLKFGIRFNPMRDYKQLVDSMFESDLLRAFFYGFPSYGGQGYREKVPGAFFIPFHMLDSGVWYPVGGVGAIPASFERLARELGVEFVQGEVASFDCDELRGRKRVRGVTLAHGERLEAEFVVSNIDRLTTEQMMGRSVGSKANLSYFTIHLGVNKPMPEVLHHSLVIPDGFQGGFRELYESDAFPTEPIVYLNNPGLIDPNSAPEGKTNLFMVITCPGKNESIDWANMIPEFKRRAMAVMARQGIEIEEELVEFERIQSPLYFEQAHGNYKGSLYGADKKHRLFGMFPLSNRDSECGNLFYAGGGVQPGAGLPMVTLSGKFAADLIEFEVQKRSK